jgi:membrane-associated phospholipid phosphatase
VRIRLVALVASLAVFAPSGLSAEASSPVDGAFPYRLSVLGDCAIGATGLGLYGASLYFESIKAAPDQSDLDAGAIPFFDRLYTTAHSASLGTAADALTIATALVPAALIPGRDGEELFTLGAMYAETLVAAYSLDTAIKSIVTRYRPYAYAASSDEFADADIADSFASRHATVAFASAVFAGRAFDEIAPDSPWRPLVWASGLCLATVTSVLRVASGEHFPSDVVAGAAFGSLCGYLVPLLHEAKAGGDGGSSGLAARSMPGGIVIALRL